jgi:DNA-binding winged helix-turn-helix (wHTH) protein
MSAIAASPVSQDSPAFRVGDWLVEPATNQLTRGATIVRLEPKAIEVLSYLAQRVGQVVPREELFEHAWPGMVVRDESLDVGQKRRLIAPRAALDL